MKQVLTFYFLFSTFYLFSQEQFNVVYTNENIANPKTVFILQDTGYATVGGASINNWGIEITIADITGNLISSRYYKKEGWDLYHGRENNCCKIAGQTHHNFRIFKRYSLLQAAFSLFPLTPIFRDLSFFSKFKAILLSIAKF